MHITGTKKFRTLSQFIIERQKDEPHATGEFTRLLHDIALAAKVVNRDVARAGLVNILGATEGENIHGEVQQKLDLLAHEEFIRALYRGGECCLIGSEEHAEATTGAAMMMRTAERDRERRFMRDHQ